MTHNPPPPKLSLLPEISAVHAGTARVARRILRCGAWPERQRHHGAAAARRRRTDGRRRRRRGGRRRRALARPDDAACRAIEARRRPAAAPAHDGGHGPAGLRPVRLQLSGLRRRDLFQEGSKAQSVCAGRQGDAAHAQGRCMARWARLPLRLWLPLWRRQRQSPQQRDRKLASPPAARATLRPRPCLSRARCSTSPVRARRPGTSSSIFRRAGSITSWAIASAFFPPTIKRWSRPSSRRSMRRPIFPSAAARFVRCSPTAFRWARRPTRCSSFTPTSPAANGGRRQRRSPRARTPMVMPRASTCSRQSKNFPACGPTRKRSSNRSSRCSRGCFPSPHRSRAIPAASRSRWTRCATRSASARGSASLPRSSASAPRPVSA